MAYTGFAQGQGGRQQMAMQLDTHGMQIDEAIAEEKRRHAERIAEDMEDLHECLVEAQALVERQDEGITKAAQHVEKSRDNVGKGTEQLHSARNHAKSSRKCMIFAFILLVVIVAIIVIVVKVAK
eukprot:TRINITY_DN39693_c0_g1_i1.p1 TRINITY_DN39693_c0_g1~~TRINITY_DN39693_c0_g1_i1.p1  ORF type:complete len:125 (+),score=39.50 TRINITY_DN39693_c0_g1_i1:72-446(+)